MVNANMKKTISLSSAFLLGLMFNSSQLFAQTHSPELQALIAAAQQDINICGTGAGETPFTIETIMVSDYNGFGVSCKDVCDAEVTVTVSGGVGPFSYSWVGGPNTATWSNACAGTQIVIVTDQGQGIQCPATIAVDDPAAVSVLLLNFAPPACAGVCNGTASVFAVGGVGPFDYDWNNGAESGPTASALCAGSNSLHVEDANGCAFDTTFVFDVQPILPNESFTDATCFNGCDGTATVAPTGGTGTYDFNWVPTPPFGQGTANASALCAGNWAVTITDQNGCDTTVNFTITEPAPIIPNPSSFDASCPDVCDGSASVSPSGGVGPYSFNWVPEPGAGQGTASATGLCAGDWAVTITDDGTGCDTTLSITIGEPPALLPNETWSDVDCAGDCSGTAAVTPTGGSGNYNFLWVPEPVSGQGTANVSGLCAGDVSVTITDQNNGCDTTVVITIMEPLPIQPNESFNDVLCAGECSGTATVSPTGGSGNYSYNWVPTPSFGQGTDSVALLCAGIWTVTITDDLNCDTSITVTIAEPDSIEPNPTFTNATCNLQCDGTAIVAPSGGTGQLTFTWVPEPPVGQGTPMAAELCAGPWTVFIEDENGCVVSHVFNIAEPSPIIPNLVVVDGTCNGVCNGSASVAPVGGTGGYTYFWVPEPTVGQGTASVDSLCAGPASVTITDSLGCDTTVSFMVFKPGPFLVNVSGEDVSCFGECDGSIDVSVGGATPPYTYFWVPEPDAGQGTPSISGLCAGEWTLVLTDSLGCDSSLVFEIVEPTAIFAQDSSANISCAGECDGFAFVNPTGGAGGFSYTWTPVPPNGQGTQAAEDLCAGVWTVLIEDADGCDTLITFNIEEPLPIEPNPDFTEASCAQCDGVASVMPTGGTGSYTYLWTPEPLVGQGTPMAEELCPGQWSVLITDSLGCDTTMIFDIGEGTEIVPNASTTSASCGGICDGTATVGPTGGIPPYTFIWSPEPGSGQGTPQATELCAGIWEVLITDSVGCDTTISLLITEPDPFMVQSTIQPVSCAGAADGSISVVVTGGTPPYTYLWSPEPGAGQGTNSVTGLAGGPWSLLVTDSLGCDTTLQFTVDEALPITATTESTEANCSICNGTATVTPMGGVGNFAYEWLDDQGIPIGQNDSIATGLCAGTYTVLVTDGDGCQMSFSIPVSDNNGEDLMSSSTMTTCPGTCDGTATVNFNCSDPPCSIEWLEANGGAPIGQNDTTATGLCAGDYLAQVTNGSGCVSIDTVQVDSPEPLVPNASTTNTSCGGICDGAATVGPTGGSGLYAYTWSPEPGGGQGTPQATGLCEGVWTVFIDDLNSPCDTTISLLIQGPTPFDLGEDVEQISCNGANDGAITLNVSGGTSPYNYFWVPEPPNGQGNAEAMDLYAGDWTVTVTDDLGCDTTVTFTIMEMPAITGILNTTNANCQVCDGTANIIAQGGSGGFTYEWLDDTATPIGQDSATAIGLCAGVYMVVVTDSDGCSSTFTVPVEDNNGEVLTSSSQPPACYGDCTGQASVSFVCSDPPCLIEWYDANSGTSLGQTDTTAVGLCAGSYYVEVVNASGCSTIDSVQVDPGSPITPNASTTGVTCNGGNDGTATVGPTGGVAPYTFVWSPEPGSGQGTPLATGLTAGIWEVLISDSTDCDTIISLLILEPDPIDPVGAVTNVNCAGTCNGSIAMAPTGGNGGFTFEWNPVPPNGQGVQTATDLCAGDWTVTVTDMLGCDTTVTFSVGENDPISATASSIDAICNVCDGTATISATGGNPPFSYEWLDVNGTPIGQDSLTAINLCAGIYEVVVTDLDSCSASFVVPVSNVDAEVLTATTTPPTCIGDCDGEATISFTCSDPPCLIDWLLAVDGSSIGQSDTTATGLCAGDYLAQVTNNSGCITIDTVNVPDPDPIVPNASTTNASCNGLCDGTATVGPSGGAGGYTYTWSPEPGGGQGTPQATALCPGVWQVTIADSVGCDTTISLLIQEPDLLMDNAVLDHLSCAGVCEGSISLAVAGGTGPYSYAWSPIPPNGDGDSTATGLCAGVWSVTVTDANLCDSTFTYNIDQPDSLVPALSITDATCSDNCDGIASVVVGGGTAPYTYLWSPEPGSGQGTPVAGGLCGGDWSVLITDSLGCDTLVNFNIIAPSPILPNLSIQGESCNGPCDGIATVTPIGGNGGYTYLWSPNPPNGQGTDSISGLCAGSWNVLISDSVGCDTLVVFDILPPQPILPNDSVEQVSCFGACDGSISLVPSGGVSNNYTVTWDPIPPGGQGVLSASGLCPETYDITITDDAGCDTTITIAITEPDELMVNIDSVQDAICSQFNDGSIFASIEGGTGPYNTMWSGPGGYTNDSLIIEDLFTGTYSVLVIDANGCEAATFAEVGAQLEVEANAGMDITMCEGIPILLDGSGSTNANTYEWSELGGPMLGNDPTVEVQPNVGTTSYVLTITNGPCTDSDTVQVTVDPTPIAEAGEDQSMYLEESVVIGGQPTGPAGSDFLWSPGSDLSDSTATNPIATPTESTWFYVTVIDPNGCVGIDSVFVEVIPEIVVPSGFTPNGDGPNDTWILDFANQFPDLTVEIYNRWGDQLFESVGYNDPWDGTYNNEPVPVGTYYYVINLNDPQYPEPFTGPLTVLR